MTGIQWLLAVFGFIFVIFSGIIALSDRANFNRQSVTLPSGSSISGVPVGGLTRPQAEERLSVAFRIPVELRCAGVRMQLNPMDLGFSMDPTISLDALEAQAKSSWWRHLWGKNQPSSAAKDYPLLTMLDENILQTTLEKTTLPHCEIAPVPSVPVLYQTNFSLPQKGQGVDLIKATELVKEALLSPTDRVVNLPIEELVPPPPDLQNLEVMLKQQIMLEGFDGLVEVFLQNPATGEILHFAERSYQSVPVDVAYTGASTVKIPIMVSVMRRVTEPTPKQALEWMDSMISQSLNPPADALMKSYLDQDRGPLLVTEDLQALGYQNSFLGGFFEPGSPLLARFTTPANSRTDVYLDPDFYNQTVPSEIGDMLTRIYRCAHTGSNVDLFPDEISSQECKTMLEMLSHNKLGVLIEAGLGPDSSAAHKHGWVTDIDGLVHTISDAGIVNSPGGDYVLVIFIHSERQLLFDVGNRLVARLSQCIYNFYNLDQQIAWPLTD